MNEKPLRVNKETWQTNLAFAEEEVDILLDFCRQMSHDDTFRPNSPADCVRVLFTEKGIKPPRVSKTTGNPSTDKDTLTELVYAGIPLAGGIIDARSAITCRGQLRKWKPYADFGQVQSIWNSMGCPHGRYTSENPSLTNRISQIRETIEPDSGYSFLSLDLGQAEFVTWISLSGDLTLGEAFLQGKDFHSETASSIKELVPSWQLNGQEPREAGKTLNFAILYQMTEYALAIRLGCSVETAADIIKAYYGRAKTASRYIDRTLALAKKTGYVQTYFGRRRYCPEYQNGISDREAHEIEKTLWNHVCAGTAAEIVKWKTVRMWEALRRYGFTTGQVRLSLNMFDEAIWMVQDDLLSEIRAIVEEIWKRKETGFLQFNSEVKVGKNWKECE
jgi:DNA polymerase-1